MNYATTFLAYQSNSLTPAQRLSYRAAGYLAESSARDNGTSLLPECWCLSGVPVDELNQDLLVLVGMTAIALADVTNTQAWASP